MRPLLYYLGELYPDMFEQGDISDIKENAEANGLQDDADKMRYICFIASIVQQLNLSFIPAILINKDNFKKLLEKDDEAIREFFEINQEEKATLNTENIMDVLNNALSDANEMDAKEIELVNPSIQLAAALMENKDITFWLDRYEPEYHMPMPFYPLETAIKMGNLEAVKTIFYYITAISPEYVDILRDSQLMEVKGRPIFWLAAVCDSRRVEPERPDDQVYIQIMEFLEKELGIGPGYVHVHINKYDYINKYAADPQKKATMLAYCNKQQSMASATPVSVADFTFIEERKAPTPTTVEESRSSTPPLPEYIKPFKSKKPAGKPG